MIRAYCDECKAMRPFRRQMGIGTLIAVLATAGFWILILPFYGQRCPECGLAWSDRQDATPVHDPALRLLLIAVIVVAALLILVISRDPVHYGWWPN